MKRSAIIISILFMASSVLCFAVPVNAENITVRTTDQVYDIYYDKIQLTQGTYYFSATNYGNVYAFIEGSGDHKAFSKAINDKKNPAMAQHGIEITTNGTNVVVFVLSYGGSESVGYRFVDSYGGASTTVIIQTPPQYPAEQTKHQLYSGQTVKLKVEDYVSGNSIYLKTEKQQLWFSSAENEIKITSTGEYVVTYSYSNSLFITYSLEYSTMDVDIAMYGYVFLIIGAGIIGLMFWSGRKQKVE